MLIMWQRPIHWKCGLSNFHHVSFHVATMHGVRNCPCLGMHGPYPAPRLRDGNVSHRAKLGLGVKLKELSLSEDTHSSNRLSPAQGTLVIYNYPAILKTLLQTKTYNLSSVHSMMFLRVLFFAQ